MEPRLFGLETEYALGVLDPRAGPLDRARLATALIAAAQATYPHLPDETLRGMFLPNGARFYLDAGHHPEMSTPECDNPWDVVRYTIAGHRILAALARALDVRQRGARTAVFRTNVDYASGNTFGSHESYGHRVAPAELAEQIIPHLVSRVIYTGAGGFDTRSTGIEFLLSPRAAHIVHEQSAESTHDRGIVHTKDEPLRGGGFHRLHLICGETTCSELSGWLRVGTTALIVALVEAGQRPGSTMRLAHPVFALRTFARDPTCTATVSTAGRRAVSALAIQRHYLAAVEAHLGDGTLPAWAPDVCAHWRAVLDELAADPARVNTSLDWAIKLALVRDRARRRGIDWDSLHHWSGIISSLQIAWRHTERRGEPFRIDVALDTDGPLAALIAELTPKLGARRLDWQDLPRVLALRQELFELDLRFGQVDDDGIFNQLDRAGVLTHHVEGVDRIDHAMEQPPEVLRARRRAQMIRELSGTDARYSCDWVSVTDHEQHRVMDLSDPFASATWTPVSADRLSVSGMIGLRRARRPQV